MRIAVYQGSAKLLDRAANLARIERLAQACALEQAELLIAPELFLTGYNMGDDTPSMAEPANGPSSRQASEIARRHGLSLIYGYPEKTAEGVYNSALAIDKDGKVVANYRKAHLFGDLERRCFVPGRDVVTTRIGGLTIGLAICYDVEFPEFIRAIVLQGADLIVVPTCLTAPYWEIPTTIVRARAYENQVFLAYSNHVGTERDFDYIGLSGIVGPDGRDIARAGQNNETLMFAEITPAQYAASRAANTYLRDRRPELYGPVAKG
jgi:predicted amidohydrolase